MQQGDRVRVKESVVVFTHPEHRGQAFDMQGQEGDVANVLNDWKGRTISPTLPVIVAFGRYKAHFRAEELEAVSWLREQLPRRRRVNLRPVGSRDGQLLAKVTPIGDSADLSTGLVAASLAADSCQEELS